MVVYIFIDNLYYNYPLFNSLFSLDGKIKEKKLVHMICLIYLLIL